MSLRTFIGALSAAFLLYFPLQAGPRQVYDGVSVMSFNVRGDVGAHKDGTNSWELRWNCVVNMIADCKPDVAGLQEVSSFQLAALKEYCNRYKFKGVGEEDGKKKGEFLTLMYNPSVLSLVKWDVFWLNDVNPDKPVAAWDEKIPCAVSWAVFKSKKSGSRFLLLNLHLDREADDARREGLRQIAAWLSDNNKDDLPVVLTGGFNMNPSDDGFASLNALGFRDARTEADTRDETRSYHGWGKTALQLDYILYKGFRLCPAFRTVTKKYPDEAGEPHFVSDHYPVLTTLIF